MRVTLTDNSGNLERVCEFDNAIITDATNIIDEIIELYEDKIETDKLELSIETIASIKEAMNKGNIGESIDIYEDNCLYDKFARNIDWLPPANLKEFLTSDEDDAIEIDRKFFGNLVTNRKPYKVKVIYFNKNTMHDKMRTLVRCGFIDTSDANIVLVFYRNVKAKEKHDEYVAVYTINK